MFIQGGQVDPRAFDELYRTYAGIYELPHHLQWPSLGPHLMGIEQFPFVSAAGKIEYS